MFDLFGVNEDVIEINQFTVLCCHIGEHEGNQGLQVSGLHQPDPILAFWTLGVGIKLPQSQLL